MISRGVLALALASVASAAGDVYNQTVTLATPGDNSAGSLDGSYNGTVDGVGYVSSDYDITWGPNLATGSVEVGNPSDEDNPIGFSTNINYTGSQLYGIVGGLLDATHTNAAELLITADTNHVLTTPSQDNDFFERVTAFIENNVTTDGIHGINSVGGAQFQNSDFQTAVMGGKYDFNSNGTYSSNWGFALDDLFATNWYLSASNAGELNISLDVWYGKLDCSNSTESDSGYGDTITTYTCVYDGKGHTSDPASWVTAKNGGVQPGGPSRRGVPAQSRGLLDSVNLNSVVGNLYGDNKQGALSGASQLGKVQDLLAFRRDLLMEQRNIKKRQVDLQSTIDSVTSELSNLEEGVGGFKKRALLDSLNGVTGQLSALTGQAPNFGGFKAKKLQQQKKRQDGGIVLDSYPELQEIAGELISLDGSSPLSSYSELSELLSELAYLDQQDPIGEQRKRDDSTDNSLLGQLPTLYETAVELQAYDQSTGSTDTQPSQLKKRQDDGVLSQYGLLDALYNQLESLDGSTPLSAYADVSEFYNELIYLGSQAPIGLDSQRKRQDDGSSTPQSLLEQLPLLNEVYYELAQYDQSTGGQQASQQKQKGQAKKQYKAAKQARAFGKRDLPSFDAPTDTSSLNSLGAVPGTDSLSSLGDTNSLSALTDTDSLSALTDSDSLSALTDSLGGSPLKKRRHPGSKRRPLNLA